jgi:hypothetical protein
MAKQRPHTIILTEIDNRNDAREVEVGVPVATIKKLVTENVTLWEKDTPRQAQVTLVERADKSVFMVKESVRQITDLLNGEQPTVETHGLR